MNTISNANSFIHTHSYTHVTPTETVTPELSERTEFLVTVQWIVNGYTIEVQFANGDVADVRLHGVDTPEVHTETDPAEFEGIPNTDRCRALLRTWGKCASTFDSQCLETDEEIRTVVDETADCKGSYGRLLIYVYDDGDLFNLLLLKHGYARLYDSTFSKRDQFESLESTAQTNRVGLWNYTAPHPDTDNDWRGEQASRNRLNSRRRSGERP